MHEKNLRAFFGVDKVHNCVMNVHGSIKRRRNLLDLVFWSGGRIPSKQAVAEEETKEDDEETESSAVTNLMYNLVPAPILKHFILVSPLIGNE